MTPSLPTPSSLLNRLRSTYWFLPSIVTVFAAALAIGLVLVDRTADYNSPWLRWAYSGGADGARALLAAVAGSTMTVVSVTLSVMVVALTVSSQHFGPRLLNSFMRDNVAQLMLGSFTGTFVYCLVVLRTVQGDDGGDRYERFVPHLAISVALGLAFISVGVLMYYVHHIARSLQVSEITAGIARELERTIERLYPAHLGHDPAVPIREPLPVPDAGVRGLAAESGYVQEVNTERLLAVASAHDTTIWITARPGTFVIEGTPIAVVHGRGGRDAEAARALPAAFTLGADRSPQQDAAFGIQQLVEVALRALSPGVNEPFTAVTSIDRLSQALHRLAMRRPPDSVRVDDTGSIRVVTAPYTFAELLPFAYESIAAAAVGNPCVSERLLAVLGDLSQVVGSPEDRRALAQVADVAMLAVHERPIRPEQRQRLQSLRSRIGA